MNNKQTGSKESEISQKQEQTTVPCNTSTPPRTRGQTSKKGLKLPLLYSASSPRQSLRTHNSHATLNFCHCCQHRQATEHKRLAGWEHADCYKYPGRSSESRRVARIGYTRVASRRQHGFDFPTSYFSDPLRVICQHCHWHNQPFPHYI